MRPGPKQALVSALTLLGAAAPAAAQERLATRRRLIASPMFQSWSFGDGILQTTLRGDTVRLSRATQLSLPVGAELRFGERWQLDIGAAVVDGRVTLDARDASLDVDEYSLSGVTDVKVALTAHVV